MHTADESSMLFHLKRILYINSMIHGNQGHPTAIFGKISVRNTI